MRSLTEDNLFMQHVLVPKQLSRLIPNDSQNDRWVSTCGSLWYRTEERDLIGRVNNHDGWRWCGTVDFIFSLKKQTTELLVHGEFSLPTHWAQQPMSNQASFISPEVDRWSTSMAIFWLAKRLQDYWYDYWVSQWCFGNPCVTSLIGSPHVYTMKCPVHVLQPFFWMRLTS